MERSGAETISWLPKEMCFTFISQGCSTWPGFRRWSSLFFSLSPLFTQGDTDVRGQSDQADALILTWREELQLFMWMDCCHTESWLVDVGHESLCQQQNRGEGGSSNEERCFKRQKGVMKLHHTFFQHTHTLPAGDILSWVHFQPHDSCCQYVGWLYE